MDSITMMCLSKRIIPPWFDPVQRETTKRKNYATPKHRSIAEKKNHCEDSCCYMHA